MSETKMISEAEAVKRERNAFREGWHGDKWAREQYPIGPHGCRGTPSCECEANAKRRYPLPKKVVPREARIEGERYRVVDGVVEYYDRDRWLASITRSTATVHTIADLIANPTHEVDADV